jgi:transcriptional regulator with XRE-family HTH domain
MTRAQPNLLLRQARLAIHPAPGTDRPMSRQELADAVNAYLYQHHDGRVCFMDGRYIGKLEQGVHRWPSEHYRAALRAVLGQPMDIDLGFFKRHDSSADEPADPPLRRSQAQQGRQPHGRPAAGPHLRRPWRQQRQAWTWTTTWPFPWRT